MKAKDKKALHTKTIEELKKDFREVRDALYLLRLDKSMMKLKNTRLIFNKRKEIAQILTIIKEKELSAARPRLPSGQVPAGEG